LLLTERILHDADPQLSVAEAVTITGIILWFGGHNTLGLAAVAPTTGGVLSCTLTVAWHWLDKPPGSIAVSVT
jgi:hypothetical protein